MILGHYYCIVIIVMDIPMLMIIIEMDTKAMAGIILSTNKARY